MEPHTGTIQGGTFVEVEGTGFFTEANDTLFVSFLGRAVVNLNIVNETYMNFRTPNMKDSDVDGMTPEVCLDSTQS